MHADSHAGDVRLYAPLLLPLGLELGAFIFLALGLAPRRREDKIATAPEAEPVAEPVATPAKRGSREYYLGRLQREHPQLAMRIEAGELSVYKASVAAGLRKPPKASAKWASVAAYVRPAGITA